MRMGEKICESHILIFFQVQSYATQKLRSTRKFTQRLSQVMDTSAAKMRPWSVDPKTNQFIYVPRCTKDKSLAKTSIDIGEMHKHKT